MKHLSKADVEEAICFILDECIRFAKMPICELKRRDTLMAETACCAVI